MQAMGTWMNQLAKNDDKKMGVVWPEPLNAEFITCVQSTKVEDQAKILISGVPATTTCPLPSNNDKKVGAKKVMAVA